MIWVEQAFKESRERQLMKQRRERKAYLLRKIAEYERELEDIEQWIPERRRRTISTFFSEREVRELIRMNLHERRIAILRRCSERGVCRNAAYGWLRKYSAAWQARKREPLEVMARKSA